LGAHDRKERQEIRREGDENEEKDEIKL